MPAHEAPGSLGGRWALVTGASRGIGAQIAVALAEAGATVGIAGRDPAGLAATRDRVAAAGGEAVELRADLSTVEGARTLARAALERSATWDVLVNNAAVAHTAPLTELEPDDVARVMTVNVTAALVLAQALVPGMVDRGAGRIINISSVGALRCTPELAAYGMSKAALNHLTSAMAVEWGHLGVLSNALCPTIIETDMADGLGTLRRPPESIPIGRYGLPREVADVVVFLAGGGASFINGTAIPLDGGLMSSAQTPIQRTAAP